MSSQPNTPPVGQLKTNRGVLKVILLSIITFGIYGIVFYYGVCNDVNTIASPYDGKKSMNYILVIILAGISFGIVPLVWTHNITNRIGGELSRRGIDYKFSASDFWIFSVLLSFTIICPILYLNKFCTALNKLCEHYNVNG